MKRTDYETIAGRYDENAIRRRFPPEEIIEELLGRAPSDGIDVLDVGCGTGNYLAAQRVAYAGRAVRWFGIDPSPAMLARARGKLPGADLRLGRAEELPFVA